MSGMPPSPQPSPMPQPQRQQHRQQPSPVPAAGTVSAGAARVAFLRACAWDVAVRKPGNVSLASAGHRMQAEQFLASAQACADAVTSAGAPAGQRIEAAVQATQAAVGCNTNLGIVLLCVPLAMAHELGGHAGGPTQMEAARALQRGWEAVTQAMTRADAAAAFRAIALAHPAGLGEVAQQDVHRPPDVDLRAAMALAAARDRVAAQYVNGAAAIFDTGLAALARHPQDLAALCAGPQPAGLCVTDGRARAVQAVFLDLLASAPDSHIVRKHGTALAHSVMREAVPWAARARAGEPLDADPAFAAWDEALKQRALNPGSTADLTVATLMAAALLHRPAGEPRSAASDLG